MTGISRRNLLQYSQLIAFGQSSLLLAAKPAFATSGKSMDASSSLREIAKKNGVLFGSAFTATGLRDVALSTLYQEQVGLLVPDYELKWSKVHPSPDVFEFGPAERLAAFASTSGMQLRGHCLAWEEWNPAWLKPWLENHSAEDALTQHIEKVVSQFAGRMHSWDVVNEPIWFEHGMPNGLRSGVWLQSLGENYIDIAFRAARRTDPTARLVINEAATETLASSSQTRRHYFLQLLDRMKDRGVPFDAVGLECHLSTESQFDRDDFAEYLHEIASKGLQIIITELDVSDRRSLLTDTLERDAAVAKVYEAVVETAIMNPSVVALLTWELSDKSSWLRDQKRPDGTTPRPLPYDVNLQPKLARSALANGLSVKRRI
jgi:endo-1,4-beta-xylanase